MTQNKARYALGAGDQAIIDSAWAARNPSIFTDYYFKPQSGGSLAYPGSLRHARYMQTWEEMGRPPNFIVESGGVRFEVIPRMGDYSDTTLEGGQAAHTDIAFFEKRGFVFLPWQLAFFKAQQEQRTLIGLTGTGKTAGIGLMAMFMCATIPGFRFLNVAPTIYQSTLMVRSIQERMYGSLFEQRFLLEGRKGFKEKPYAMYKFNNGSTAEFMNVERNAANVQSWYGDWVNVDEAGLLNDTDESGMTQLSSILIGLATRLRGERPDGRPRLGWLSLISMAYDCDTLWELYDYGHREENRKSYYSALVTHKDNPYLTPKDIERIKRNIPQGQEGQWLRGERPTKKGAEFPHAIIEMMFSEKQMELAIANPDVIIEYTRPGITLYEEPYIKDHVYMMAGDPGLGEPPYRNAPVILLFDVTDFPDSRAKLAGFWWGYANGSLMPFLNRFDQYASLYRVPNVFRGYDSTASQKHIAELAFQSGENDVIPLGFEGSKKWEYINALKLLMSKGLIQIPKGISGIENQMRNYRLPDKKLAQDIVSTLCMAAFLIYPLYRDSYPEEWNDEQIEKAGRLLAEAAGRSYRPGGDRHAGRGGSLYAIEQRPAGGQGQPERS